jgi:hypothetical protein
MAAKKKADIFDRISPDDLFDRVELSFDDQVDISDGLAKKIRSEIGVATKDIPEIFGREMARQRVAQETLERKVSDTKSSVESKLKDLIEDFQDMKEQFRRKLDHLRNELRLSESRYTFGGFSPIMNNLNIGLPDTEGSWRIVQSDDNLAVERYESGAWVEKGAFLP